LDSTGFQFKQRVGNEQLGFLSFKTDLPALKHSEEEDDFMPPLGFFSEMSEDNGGYVKTYASKYNIHTMNINGCKAGIHSRCKTSAYVLRRIVPVVKGLMKECSITDDFSAIFLASRGDIFLIDNLINQLNRTLKVKDMARKAADQTKTKAKQQKKYKDQSQSGSVQSPSELTAAQKLQLAAAQNQPKPKQPKPSPDQSQSGPVPPPAADDQSVQPPKLVETYWTQMLKFEEGKQKTLEGVESNMDIHFSKFVEVVSKLIQHISSVNDNTRI
jgi:hypothetical protein